MKPSLSNVIKAFIIFCVVIAGVALYETSQADGDCRGDGSCNSASNTIGGDSAKTFAYGGGLGDTDINDCIVTTQIQIIVFGKQGFEYNPWCIAEAYDRKQMFRMAAIMRCIIPDITERFTNEQDCITANLMGYIEVPQPAEIESPDEDEDDDLDHEEFRADMLAKMANLESARADDRKRLEATQRRAKAEKQQQSEIAQSTLDQYAQYAIKEE